MGASDTTGGLEFGAEQAILVSDESTKIELQHRIGDKALVLTPQECKGLEFMDVLIYNFIGGSGLSSKWRVLYGYLHTHGLISETEASSSRYSYPVFSADRHHSLMACLKQLYVLITRAKNRLWIMEDSVDDSAPLLHFWSCQHLLLERTFTPDFAVSMQRASSAEEWRSKALQLLKSEHYQAAKRYFEKAGDTKGAALAEAKCYEREASGLPPNQWQLARELYIKAAGLFRKIDRPSMAANCLYRAKDFHGAGLVWCHECDPPEYSRAAHSFKLAASFTEAAIAFSDAGETSEALECCKTGHLYQLGLDLIIQWQADGRLPSSELTKLHDAFVLRCARSSHISNNKEAVMNMLQELPSHQRRITMLERFGYWDEVIALETEVGNFARVAPMLEMKGDLKNAACMYYKQGQVSHALQLLSCWVWCTALWGHKAANGWRVQQNDDLILNMKALTEMCQSSLETEAAALPMMQSTRLLMELCRLPLPAISLSDIQRLWSQAKECQDPTIQLLLSRTAIHVLQQPTSGKGDTQMPVLGKQDILSRLGNPWKLLERTFRGRQPAETPPVAAGQVSSQQPSEQQCGTGPDAAASRQLPREVPGEMQLLLIEFWTRWQGLVDSMRRVSLRQAERGHVMTQGEQQLLAACDRYLGVSSHPGDHKLRMMHTSVWLDRQKKGKEVDTEVGLKEITRESWVQHMDLYWKTHALMVGRQVAQQLTQQLPQLLQDLMEPQRSTSCNTSPTIASSTTPSPSLEAKWKLGDPVLQRLSTVATALLPLCESSTMLLQMAADDTVRELQKCSVACMSDMWAPKSYSMSAMAAMRYIRQHEKAPLLVGMLSHDCVERKVEAAAKLSLLLPFLDPSSQLSIVQQMKSNALWIAGAQTEDPGAPSLACFNYMVEASTWQAHAQRHVKEPKAMAQEGVIPICAVAIDTARTVVQGVRFLMQFEPHTFVSLVEQATVLSVCVSTGLHNTVLPGSLALRYMVHPCQHALFTGYFRRGADPRLRSSSRRHAAAMLEAAALLLRKGIPSSPHTTPNSTSWEAAMKQPWFVWRLLSALVTDALNHSTHPPSSMRAHKRVFMAAADLLQRLPLSTLPPAIVTALREMAKYRPQLLNAFELSRAFQRALGSYGDTLVVLWRRGSYELGGPLGWAVQLPAAYVYRDTTEGAAFAVEEILGVFGWTCGDGEKAEAPSAPATDSPVESRRERMKTEDYQPLEDAAEDEAYGMPLESTGLLNAPDLVMDAEDQKMVDTLTRVGVVPALMAWLQEARRTIQGQVSPCERYAKEARRVLGGSTCKGGAQRKKQAQEYLEFYILHVCPVQVDMMEILKGVAAMRHASCVLGDDDDDDDSRLDELLDIGDRLRPIMEQLDARSSHHAQLNIGWLHQTVSEAASWVQEAQQLLKQQ